jgi:hypothetical protein
MGIEVIKIPLLADEPGHFIKQGDTIPSYLFRTTASALPWWTYTDSEISFKIKRGSELLLEKDNADIGGVTVNNANEFTIEAIPGEENNLPAGELNGDVTIKFSNGVTKTIADFQITILKAY